MTTNYEEAAIKEVTNCDDCPRHPCHAPIVLDGVTYCCLIDEKTGEWLE